MERREDSFYTAYSYGDKLEEGHKLTLEHLISFDQRHADLSALTWMPLDRLQALRNKSVETEKAIVRTSYGDVLPSSKALAGASVEMIDLPERQFRLRMALEQVRDNYDYVFIDCPPSLELLTLNALCAADSLLVPLQGEYYALEGLSDLMNTVRLVRRSLNPKLEIEGVLLTMFDGRTNLAIQVAQEVKRFFPGKVYATVIPRNVRLSEAPSHGKPITSYDRSCRGAEAYVQLAQEFLKRNNG